MNHFKLVTAIFIGLMQLSCTTNKPSELTLRDIDLSSPPPALAEHQNRKAHKIDGDARKAYTDYLASAAPEEKGRKLALYRVANLELKQAQEKDQAQEAPEQAGINQSILNTTKILETALAEFPKDKGNHVILYQLAQNHEKLGNHQESLARLRELVDHYPDSKHAPEAHFRIAEHEFLEGNLINAEIAYSEVIFAGSANPLYEKALIKRGWSRYQQGLYSESIEDFAEAIKTRNFGSEESLSALDQHDYNEYFRAIALSAQLSGDFNQLNLVFNQGDQARYIFKANSTAARLLSQKQQYKKAATILANYYATSADPLSAVKAKQQELEILYMAGDHTRFTALMGSFYHDYGPNNQSWSELNKGRLFSDTQKTIRKNMLLIADQHQTLYVQNNNRNDFDTAKKWYQRYLDNYPGYARKDKAYSAYGRLLYFNKNYAEALTLFEQAAYDGEILLDKEAAYTTIELCEQLLSLEPNSEVLYRKLINYAQSSIRLYGDEQRYHSLYLYTLEKAYQKGRYADSINLSANKPNNLSTDLSAKASYITAMALIKNNQAPEAELLLSSINNQSAAADMKIKFKEASALSIYQQGDELLAKGDVSRAIDQFSRVVKADPSTSIANSALYKAVELSIKHEYWEKAAAHIETFISLYPNHSKTKDLKRQSSMVYLKLDLTDKAAIALENISADDSDEKVKMAALWQAGSLYEKQRKTDDAIRTYEAYARTYTSPYPQYVEAMEKLISLYSARGDISSKNSWMNKLINADQKSPDSIKTVRTKSVVASTLLALAAQQYEQFKSISLVAPLTENLRRKKQRMQAAIELYGQAASYQITEVTFQSTHAIGDIYLEFSRSLLNSQRPKNLSDEELEQYEILIEDQAFPFEEKAIEFYEMNLARTASGQKSPWARESLLAIRELFPARYGRKAKLEIYRSQGT